MRQPIDDEFAKLNVSRQRKWQLRKQRDGRCTECGEEAVDGASRCVKHIVRARERQRKKKGSRARYSSLSYRLESQTGVHKWRHVHKV